MKKDKYKLCSILLKKYAFQKNKDNSNCEQQSAPVIAEYACSNLNKKL